MRDVGLMLLIIGASLYALRQPWIGVLMWSWVSLMNPHNEFTYAAANWPVASIVAIGTLLGVLFTRDKQSPLLGAPMVTLLAFVIWTCITLPFSFYLDASLSLWERSMKIYLMVFVTVVLIDNKKKLDLLIWVCVVSIGYYGVKGGLFTLATAGNYRVWGPGGFIGGNNEVAAAVILIIPLMRYLQLQLTAHWAQMCMMGAMGLCAITALGTYSRGALLGVAAMSVFLWWKGNKKLPWGVALIGLGILILSFMPDLWWERMYTIQNYEQDDSAQGRINAWWNAWNLAKDRIVGGGFMIYEPEVFARYSPNPERIHAAHSIYFQVLGEHGFIGLALFLAMGVLTWISAARLIHAAKLDAAHKWAADLGSMVQVSIIGFGVTGAFLSLAYYDMPYNIMAFTVLALHFVKRGVPVPVKFPYSLQKSPATLAGAPRPT
jgi:putative inorganic carbon (hco3(-)) transporter